MRQYFYFNHTLNESCFFNSTLAQQISQTTFPSFGDLLKLFYAAYRIRVGRPPVGQASTKNQSARMVWVEVELQH